MLFRYRVLRLEVTFIRPQRGASLRLESHPAARFNLLRAEKGQLR
jgi:hypothetical protein